MKTRQLLFMKHLLDHCQIYSQASSAMVVECAFLYNQLLSVKATIGDFIIPKISDFICDRKYALSNASIIAHVSAYTVLLTTRLRVFAFHDKGHTAPLSPQRNISYPPVLFLDGRFPSDASL